MSATTKPVMTRAEFERTPEFLACSAKQRLFLLTLIENGFDYAHATASAFDCKNLRNALMFSYAVRRWRVIRNALNIYFGRRRTPQDVLLEQVDENLRRADPGSVAAQRLLALKKQILSEGDAPKKSKAAPVDDRVPTDALKVWRKDGVVVGFRNAQGEDVRF